jgi:head-tail adaptor
VPTLASFAALLNVTVTISRKSRTSDGQGGWTEALVEQDAVPGRVRPVTPGEETVGGQREVQITHVAYFALGVDVQRDDQLVYVAPNGEAKTLIVRAVREPSQPNHLQIDCEERQHGGTADA